jgi:catalase
MSAKKTAPVIAKSATKPSRGPAQAPGNGGELHQTAATAEQTLTTNQGTPVSDDQNSLKAGVRGPTLLEDFVLREKITHFDHERIPERIVHARGSGAHGYFQPYKSLARLTKAGFLQDPEVKTPVFVRFSTVAGGAGSVDTPRDVRGFAVKFYTQEGNFDLVGNNIPVFFIQDTMKFPDLIHSVKMEPDRGFPQAASAHDTFWDFVSLMPESVHMLLWAMSDRTIPRSLRMMEGFGIHTFRFVDAKGRSTFVKFHWRPKLGTQSTLWDEAVKLAGADPDFHRRDLWEAIDSGDFPEWELCIQSFDESISNKFQFDVLDSTKLIPEELVPLEPVGTLVLDRNPDNFFAETEQVAFHPGHVVPGIDFSDDPLLQGRLFSYLDTQLSRLGGPNFHEIPINRPKCPYRNLQRDGISRMENPPGRVAYEPNSLDPAGPREDPQRGFTSVPAPFDGEKVRRRAESFSDHYSQARLFYRSMSAPERLHIMKAFAFELGKLETPAIRSRMLGHLQIVDAALFEGVADALGHGEEPDAIEPSRTPIDLPDSPALSMVKKAKPTLAGRKVGILVSDGVDSELVQSLRDALMVEGGKVQVVAPKKGGVKGKAGDDIPADHALAAAPSVVFDAVVLALGSGSGLENNPLAVNFVRDAFGHLKVIGHLEPASALLEAAKVVPDEGVIAMNGSKDVSQFVGRAKGPRIWAREPS